MSTNLMAMGVALVAVSGLVVTVGALSLVVGAFNQFFGRPRLKILKSANGNHGFAAQLQWNESKDAVSFNLLRVRLFNPHGQKKHVEIVRKFPKKDTSFAYDFDLGPSYETLLNLQKAESAIVQVEFQSQEGLSQQFDFNGKKFLNMVNSAIVSVTDLQKMEKEEAPVKAPVYGVVPKDTVADTVPGKGPQLKLATNPVYAAEFAGAQAAQAGGAEGAAAAQENFSIKKVWIIDGCIVCNACEDIYPEVFDVQADTCIVRPNPPLDDGLKIAEAADACPVEVIKFERA